MGQKYPKRTGKKQWLKLFVLTFAVADAAGIYVAHKRLTAPVPGSVQGELLAYSEGTDASVPHVVSVIEPGASNVAVNTSSLTVNPDLRFAPDHAVPAYIEAPAAKQLGQNRLGPNRLGKSDLPSPAFGNASQKPAALAVATPAKPKAPTLLHTTPAPQTAAVSFDKPSARLTSYVPAQRQITAFAPVRALAANVHAVPSPKLARMAARQTAALAPVHLGAATMHAVPSPKIARIMAASAASSVQTTVHHTALHHVHHNSVQLQAPSFSAAFADMSANTAKADQSAAPVSDWTPATSDFQHVATAPSAASLPDSAAAPVSDNASAPSVPAPASELPASSPAPDGAG